MICSAARGQSSTANLNLDQPYSMEYTHDAFGHITERSGSYYNTPDPKEWNYTNNRNPYWTYDDDGNVTLDDDASFETDGAGLTVKTAERNVDEPSEFNPPTADYFDGTGGLMKRTASLGSTEPAPKTSYFIRSSVLSKVVSEADGTGKKVKTFVPANGTTLAEQHIATYPTTTEVLTFLHQDASGASVQQTDDDGDLVNPNYRTGEYDAMGRNIAQAGHYITLYTPPSTPDDGGSSGVDMFGSSQGYRPGRASYAVNGIPVSVDYFILQIDTGAIGGAFGLLEMAARMSSQVIVRAPGLPDRTLSQPPIELPPGGSWQYMYQNWGMSGLISVEIPTQVEDKNEKDQKVLDLAKQALANQACAKIFYGNVMGMSATAFFDRVRSKISFADELTSNHGEPAGGRATGFRPSPGSTSTIRKPLYNNTGEIYDYETVTRTVHGSPGILTSIEITRPRGGFFARMNGTNITIEDAVEAVIHELGHGAVFLFGDKASSIVSDGYPDDKEKHKIAQEKNRETTKECRNYINGLKK